MAAAAAVAGQVRTQRHEPRKLIGSQRPEPGTASHAGPTVSHAAASLEPIDTLCNPVAGGDT